MCHFVIPFTITPEELFERIKELIKGHGSVSGNASSGSFEVKIPLLRNIEGTYQIANQEITIDISKKPTAISCETIEQEIKKHI